MAAPCGVRRPNSCSSTPCKVIESFGERLMHTSGIFRGKDLLPPGLELFAGDAAVMRRNVQRPAKVFARMTQADTMAIMTTDLIIERADEVKLLFECRRGLGFTAFETSPDLARQPGSSL